ncbi:hypothetical protein HNR59_003971 [Aquamicrobium lusatiense]|uniref:Uncharacterized protein n=1 Tax=Aquamicrobium lusatiense TaxID=89772 RepID=A0A7W9S5N8_9HYPH|nr:hypothetical protein [Aquamicrobium lusatiense]MBB6014576.1 hypothetical protein [Aquamicrobium lusatiense]
MTVQEYARPLIAHMMGKGASGPLVDKVFGVVIGMCTETFRTSLNAITLYDGQPALEALKEPTQARRGNSLCFGTLFLHQGRAACLVNALGAVSPLHAASNRGSLARLLAVIVMMNRDRTRSTPRYMA